MQELKTCPICGDEFKTRHGKDEKFCGYECSARGRGGKTEYNSKEVKCDNPDCSNTLKVKKSKRENQDHHFCSRGCYYQFKRENQKGKNNSAWKGGKVKKTCEECGKEYKVRQCLSNKTRFCSMSCLGVNTVKNMPKNDTKIEKIIEDWLEQQDVPFEKQRPIGGFTIVDFFIYPDICVYCDGDYWHSKQETKKRDKQQTKKLKEMDFKVIRLSGTEIKNGKRPDIDG